MTTPRVAVGLDLQAPVLRRAGATRRSSVGVGVAPGLPAGLPAARLPVEAVAPTATAADRRSTSARRPARPRPVSPADRRAGPVDRSPSSRRPAARPARSSWPSSPHRGLLANANAVVDVDGLRPARTACFAVLPMFHVYGLTTCLMTGVYSAAEMIAEHAVQRPTTTLDLLRRDRPTVFPLVPAICDAISDRLRSRTRRDGRDGAAVGPGLRLCVSGRRPPARRRP